MKTVSPKVEDALLQVLFFVFAIFIMAWVPRFPEVKANLGLSNGQFGTLISTGTLGALGSLFFTGHIVHKFGTKVVLLANATLMTVALSSIVQTKSSTLFLFFNIILGWGISGFHIAVNAQAFDSMNRVKDLTISKLHGIWALGALATSIISALVVNHIGLALHVGGLSIAMWLLIFISVNHLSPILMKANEDKEEHLPLRTLFSSFRVDWLVSGGLLCAVFLEFSTGDWSAIFAKERIGVNAGLAALPYIFFMIAMITGRLGANRITQRFHIHHTVRFLALVGGFGFLAFLTIAVHIPASHKHIALAATCIAFIFAGAGSSLMAPTFYTAGNRRSSLPSAVVVGQMGVINNSAVFILKACVAWTAQFTGSLAIALTIPAAMLISAAFFARAVKVD
ncbi:MFS transporter [Actinobacteria bacterium IMCC26103]|nr:MFS transporter [Actinobacteria bacterium IMCC26103]